MSSDSNCQHTWAIVGDTETVGENIQGKQVFCYGEDLKCSKCDVFSWQRNNVRTEQEENDRLWAKVL